MMDKEPLYDSLDGEKAWQFLLRHYAYGRKLCNCKQAYCDINEDGVEICPHGCATNRLRAKYDLANRIMKDVMKIETCLTA